MNKCNITHPLHPPFSLTCLTLPYSLTRYISLTVFLSLLPFFFTHARSFLTFPTRSFTNQPIILFPSIFHLFPLGWFFFTFTLVNIIPRFPLTLIFFLTGASLTSFPLSLNTLHHFPHFPLYHSPFLLFSLTTLFHPKFLSFSPPLPPSLTCICPSLCL